MADLVLIIDDNVSLCRVLERWFRTSGWDVVAASSIAAGLALLETSPGYLVVDLELPDGHGEEIVRAALEAEIPPCVVVCTGVVDPNRLQAVHELGPRAVLAKPVEFSDILAVFAS